MEGRLAVVTGAGGGVGRATARLLKNDWEVIATARNHQDLQALEDLGVTAVNCDVRNRSSIKELADIVAGRPVDALIHAAAVSHTAPAVDSDETMWEVMLSTNVIGPAMLTSALIDNLRKAKGTVVFINSGAGERGVPLHAVYAASKHALRGYANTLRMEESPNGIRVSAIYPGQINTGMLRTINSEMGLAFEPEHYIDPVTVARAIQFVVEATDDVHISNMDLRPRVEVSPKFNV
ncbi:SDR family oxidoreductase [Bifidobacterium lemurum]|uniref:SDR family oxidoreductase n=1 Tax=Bifidobacterium lemurum TaxID=1603886 RepID=A0A261FRI8_9BIFI|nr:SDR family oxidoreductase [Bifidobacterium lemurum]OZG61794.1 SDR family oxidoreductase [Bifidobacterium lemurum]QOL34945.1 SDR family oxidoreductase [Bifidobacterium lemurum]